MTVRCFQLTDAGLQERPTDAASLDALSLALPRGAYTTFRTYEGTKALDLAGHLDRLVESAAIEGQSLTLDQARARAALAEALARCGFAESRVRLTLPYEGHGDLYLALEPFDEPGPELYRSGVRCATAPADLRRERPRAKSTRFIAPASQARAAGKGVNELLLLDDAGRILEGSSSNFYGVLDGALRTAEEGVLAGITRGIVLGLAEGLLRVDRQPIAVADLPRLQEAFLTSVSRGVLPVVAIDDRQISDGAPGPVTVELGRRFGAYIRERIEPIAPDVLR
jgi:branched-chain amino acid aminotransferase